MNASLLLGCLLLASCAGLRADAERQAARELRCAPPGLRVRAVGVLQSRGPAKLQVSVFDAEGCDAEQRFFCTKAADAADGAADGRRGPRCAGSLAELAPEAARTGLERALELLRSAARGRCPGETLRVEQESASLFTYQACDGRWQYHCRARGCERLR